MALLINAHKSDVYNSNNKKKCFGFWSAKMNADHFHFHLITKQSIILFCACLSNAIEYLLICNFFKYWRQSRQIVVKFHTFSWIYVCALSFHNLQLFSYSTFHITDNYFIDKLYLQSHNIIIYTFIYEKTEIVYLTLCMLFHAFQIILQKNSQFYS